MSDIIQILPDFVANQIAAGEVIHRPSSVVKELLENAIDSGTENITVIIKDGGKTLVQVNDDGCGMSETDARLCFERHATSKIRNADDLYNIRTHGFRGEALASIAAVAHVELKTKLKKDEVGTLVSIEGSEVITHEPCSCTDGSTFLVKNLFFNTPARRKFLKSNQIELQHIIDEFLRIALAYPHIAFYFYNEDKELYHLTKSQNSKQRIISVYGKNYQERLFPVEERTNLINISGYISKPQYAKKSRKEQFLFVNKRFFRHSYFNFIISDVFKNLVPPEHHVSYFLYFDVDPKRLDVNIHPTKTEVKFEDENIIFAIFRSSLRLSIGKYNIAPVLDFEQDRSFDIPPRKQSEPIKIPSITINPDYNPFETDKRRSVEMWDLKNKKIEIENLKNFYEGIKASSEFGVQGSEVISQDSKKEANEEQLIKAEAEFSEKTEAFIVQIHNQYIITNIKSGIIIIDQQNAHERILYEELLKSSRPRNDGGTSSENKINSQQLLFPEVIELSTADCELMKELQQEIIALGFDIYEFGKNTFIIHGIPTPTLLGQASRTSTTDAENLKTTIVNLLEDYRQSQDFKIDRKEKITQTLSKNMAIKRGKKLTSEEMNVLISRLFSCTYPYFTPSGKPTIINITNDYLMKQFQK